MEKSKIDFDVFFVFYDIDLFMFVELIFMIEDDFYVNVFDLVVFFVSMLCGFV